MAKRVKPQPRYEWIRQLGMYGIPGLAESISPDFWQRVDAVAVTLLPSQRAVFLRYRSGMGVAAIASDLGCKKKSIYNRLGEVDMAFRRGLG